MQLKFVQNRRFLPLEAAPPLRDRLHAVMGRSSLEAGRTQILYSKWKPEQGMAVGIANIYIVDEHDSVRHALAERLARAAGLKVIGHSGIAEQVISEVSREPPDVVLIEIKRSDGMGLELVRQLAGLAIPPKLVVLTSYRSGWEEAAAYRAGASSYLLKDIASEDLIETLAHLG
jgi:CheY-like chemotaxis protein